MEDENTIFFPVSELRYVHDNSISGKFGNMNQVDPFGIMAINFKVARPCCWGTALVTGRER